MIFVYATTAAFAKDNPETVRKFREALVDAAAFMTRNPDKAREDISKYTKLSLNVVKNAEALVDAAAFMTRNPDKAREDISKYTKLSLDVVKNVPLPELQIESNAKRLVDWIDIMNEQKMLKGKIDEARLNVR